MIRTFLWGAPSTSAGKAAYKRAILAKYRRHFRDVAAIDTRLHLPEAKQLVDAAIESQAYEAAVQNAETILQRVTDKSSGLLQAIAVAGAFISVVAPQKEAFSLVANYVGFAIIALFLVASAFLIRNLRLVWYRDASVYEDRERDLDRVLTLVVARSRRLTLSLTLSMVAVFVLGITSVASVEPEIGEIMISGLAYLIGAGFELISASSA